MSVKPTAGAMVRQARAVGSRAAGVACRMVTGSKRLAGSVAAIPGYLRRRMKDAMVQTFYSMWPLTWCAISAVNAIVPERGRVRQSFVDLVFTRHWNRWYKLAYIPEHRDRYFEHIVTFFYQYPIRKGDVVMQIGASSGEEAIRFAKAVGTKGRHIAIEPEVGNIERLRQLFLKKQFPQVTIVPKGAWKERGELRFFIGGEKEHRLADIPSKEITYEWWGVTDHLQESRYKGSTTVEVDTVDNIVADLSLDRIDFVLIETNGSELEVVEGMEKSLPIIKRIGARGHVMRDGVPSYHAIAAILTARGFVASVNAEGMVLASRGSGQQGR